MEGGEKMKLPHYKTEKIQMEFNSRIYYILNLIDGGSKEWLEWDEKDLRDAEAQRSWKKFRKKQYKVVEKSYI